MSEFKRAILIVLDGVGAGANPDASAYGDEGASSMESTLHWLEKDFTGLFFVNVEFDMLWGQRQWIWRHWLVSRVKKVTVHSPKRSSDFRIGLA